MSTQIIERMAVEIDGSGDAVICIHGLGGTSNVFTPQMPVLGSYRVVRPDLLCSGRSPLGEKPSLAGYAECIARMADVLGIRSAHIIGHSMGTIIGQHLAVAHGPQVKSLTLLGAMIELSDASRTGLRARAAKARAEGMADIAESVVQNGLAAETKRSAPVAVALVREMMMRQPPEGYARTCEAMADGYAADLQQIRCPVLILTGEDDQTAPVSVARDLASRLANARVVTLPRCSHWPTVERPDLVNAEIQRFVR